MSFDLETHLGAMTREVRNTERDGKPAKMVVLSRVYDTDAADLWDALVRPERIKRWFAPVSGDLRRGGRYQVEGNAGGTITACVPNRQVALTWEFGGGISWVELDLAPEGDGTRLELRHIAHIDPHWETYGPGAVGVGWDLGFMGLARHIAEPDAAVALEAIEAWFATDEYKGLVRATSHGWGQAAIAAGEAQSHALEAAEATRMFYVGETAQP